jgi:acyl-CoA synthetase (AMP-forming)/AMP-acid ligase II
VDAQPSTPIRDEMEGDFLLYSSGTTGRPKGIKRALALAPMGQGPPAAVPFLQALGFASGDVYLCPAPLYHAAPLAWSMAAHRLGGTVVVMERFDPAECLALIERYHVTHAQFVPTMFVRMLKLPEEERSTWDVSSLEAVVHAAAPCPVDVKQAMIDWWGPIISEYYSATEGIGATFITAPDWLAHRGSVGKAMMGVAHILDDAGNELPSGEVGAVWFSGGVEFNYHNDPQKTAEATDARGYSTVGDVGYLDEEGYLYLTDRKAFMIISGGVNIYPQEAENVLINHPKVLDVGVIGVPDAEMGEAVKAIVQPADWDDAGPELEAELIAYCRDHLASYKCPRSVDFDKELPRLDTGKLYKKQLRARYWPEP